MNRPHHYRPLPKATQLPWQSLPATRWGPIACLLLLVAVGVVLGAPVAALAAVAATSVLSLGLRVGFLRHPPPSDSPAALESVAQPLAVVPRWIGALAAITPGSAGRPTPIQRLRFRPRRRRGFR
jgi:hypothetical protein